MNTTITVTLALALAASAAATQPTITPLGYQSATPHATAVSADGTVVVGYGQDGNGYLWKAGQPQFQLPWLERPATTPRAVSGSGAVVVGQGNTAAYEQRAFRWTDPTGTVSLGTLGGNVSDAYGVSADGSVVVGRSLRPDGFYRGYRWTAAGGMVPIGTLGGDHCTATGVSSDGNVVVGWSLTQNGTTTAYTYTPGSPPQSLEATDVYASIARGVSGDGHVVIGSITVPIVGGSRMCHWVDRVYAEIGTLGGTDADALAASADGAVIVGWSYTDTGAQRATIWTQNEGLRDLNAYLISKGVNLTGWTLTSATGISADGSVIAGDGAYNGFPRAFVIRGLPPILPPCPADLGVTGGTPGHDGVLDNNDFVVFIDLFFAQNPAADVGRTGGLSGADGVFDNNDFVVFIDLFFAGC